MWAVRRAVRGGRVPQASSGRAASPGAAKMGSAKKKVKRTFTEEEMEEVP